MDIALCIIDTEKMELQFSGAFNPVFIISNNSLEVLRGDRIPIGYTMKEDVFFSRQHLQLNAGDIIYLLSDGYCDQLGGESRKKYMTKRFNHLLLDIYQFPLEKQKEWLDKTFSEWMGDNDQVDDVTVIGVKI
jgi:serine phosphatase RsbU (regulator of sigma subunit)